MRYLVLCSNSTLFAVFVTHISTFFFDEGYNIEVHHRNTKISKYKKPRCRPQYWCIIGTHRSSFYSNLLIHAKLLRRLLVRLWQRKLALPGHAGGQSGFQIIVMLAIWLVYMISVKYALSLLSAVW
jgi:hypothetical protein